MIWSAEIPYLKSSCTLFLLSLPTTMEGRDRCTSKKISTSFCCTWEEEEATTWPLVSTMIWMSPRAEKEEEMVLAGT